MQVKEKVFILRKTRYGDTDLILNCLTPNGARISLYARSALKSKKRFGGGVLEPTHYVHVLYDDKTSRSHSQNPLHVLKEATLLEGFDGLRTDYERIDTALYFVKLIADVTREGDVDSAGLFNLLGNTLKAAEKTENLDRLRTHFEAKVLSNQGMLAVDDAQEQLLAKAPVADHAKLPIDEGDWSLVRSRIRRSLREYLEHHTSLTDARSYRHVPRAYASNFD